VNALRQRFSESLGAFRDVFRNPNLRRVELAWAESEMGDWAAAIALAVFAYDAGGAAAVGVVYVIRMLPSAFAAPFTAILADRYPRRLVMVAADLARAACMAVAAVAVFADAPAWVVYVLVGVVALVATAFHPAQAAIMPSLARTPDELTAANVASSTIESVTSFAGPALAGIVVATTDIGVAFAITAGTFLWSALLLARIRGAAPEEAVEAPEPESIARSLVAGFAAIGKDAPLRVLVGLYAAQTLVSGALNVLVVVVALEFLDTGDE
jgi:MFS family permease